MPAATVEDIIAKLALVAEVFEHADFGREENATGAVVFTVAADAGRMRADAA